MLPFRQYLEEKRKNPDINVKTPEIDIIDNFNAYMTFTDVNKLGINPINKYGTPTGVYSYPIHHAIRKYEMNRFGLAELPFATERKYILIFKVKNTSGLVSGSTYKEHHFDEDVEKLRGIIKRNNKPEVFYSRIETYQDAARIQTPLGWIWNVTRELSDRNVNKWSKLLRDIGITGVIDEGKGIIHKNEPCQAVFFDSSNLSTIELVVREKANTLIPEFWTRDITEAIEKFFWAASRAANTRKWAFDVERTESDSELENKKFFYLINYYTPTKDKYEVRFEPSREFSKITIVVKHVSVDGKITNLKTHQNAIPLRRIMAENKRNNFYASKKIMDELYELMYSDYDTRTENNFQNF